MRLLDLYCGAGGAARGYQLAGFHVTGVDNQPQPRYAGHEFVLGDALEYAAIHGAEFDAIHASPPCQAYTPFAAMHRDAGKSYPDLVIQTRRCLAAAEVPYVIENVPGAPLTAAIILCGTQFGLLVRRHRLFEVNWPLPGLLPPCICWGGVSAGRLVGHREGGKPRPGRRQPPNFRTAERQAAMGIDWMTNSELRQAIPPAFTRWIGERLAVHLAREIPA